MQLCWTQISLLPCAPTALARSIFDFLPTSITPTSNWSVCSSCSEREVGSNRAVWRSVTPLFQFLTLPCSLAAKPVSGCVAMIASYLWRIGLVGLAWALAGCGKASPPSRPTGHPLPPSALAAQCEPGKAGGRFVMAAANSPKTFNPLVAADAASDAIIRLLNASLINLHHVSQDAGSGL